MRPSDLPQRPIAELAPYARNSRTHSEEQIAQLAASIREFGFTNPVLVDAEGTIIAGHGRVLAAERAGLDSVPVLDLGHLTPDQRRAYVIADNKLALNAGWDDDILRAEMAALEAAEFDLDILGFGADELDALLNPPNPGERDPDETPEAPTRPVTQMGDVWLLGSHRLICGDSTDPEIVERLLAGAKPHLMVTDPPYGVEYDANWRNERVRSDGSPIAGRAVGKVANDERADWRAAYDLFPGDAAYAWSAGLRSREAIEGLEAAGFEIRAQIIWAKQQFAIGRGHYHFQHEPCWYAVRKGRNAHWAGDRKQTTLWNIDKPHKSETGHSTQKPIECMKRPIENNSKPGDAVYEPFSGSGTTIIAAEMTGRRCYAVELSPAYVDVAVRRWEDFAGRVATLEATGQTFREVAEERRQQAAA